MKKEPELTKKRRAKCPYPGANLRHGPNDGNGGHGRTKAFKEACRDLADDGAKTLKAREVLSNPQHPIFISALKWASEHGYGKPTESVDVTVGGQVQVVIVADESKI